MRPLPAYVNTIIHFFSECPYMYKPNLFRVLPFFFSKPLSISPYWGAHPMSAAI